MNIQSLSCQSWTALLLAAAACFASPLRRFSVAQNVLLTQLYGCMEILINEFDCAFGEGQTLLRVPDPISLFFSCIGLLLPSQDANHSCKAVSENVRSRQTLVVDDVEDAVPGGFMVVPALEDRGLLLQVRHPACNMELRDRCLKSLKLQ